MPEILGEIEKRVYYDVEEGLQISCRNALMVCALQDAALAFQSQSRTSIQPVTVEIDGSTLILTGIVASLDGQRLFKNS